jgi:hypothetical protein
MANALPIVGNAGVARHEEQQAGASIASQSDGSCKALFDQHSSFNWSEAILSFPHGSYEVLSLLTRRRASSLEMALSWASDGSRWSGGPPDDAGEPVNLRQNMS